MPPDALRVLAGTEPGLDLDLAGVKDAHAVVMPGPALP